MRARILLLPGDGVGPEVVAQGRRVLETVARTFGHELTLVEGLLGATAMDAVGRALPAETVAACRVCDAVLVGAVHGQAHEPAAVALRELCRRCDLHTSMVPMRYWSGLRYASPQRASALAGVDLMLVRDRAGVGGWGGDVDDAHRDAFRRADLTSDHRLLPVIRAGFRAAARRTGRLTAIDPVDPSLERRRWRALVARVAASWPDVAVERTDVEAATHRLRERPARWDVVLACGAGHDRLHRELAALTGSSGLLPSATIGDGTFGVFEPAHGAAVHIAGRDRANPTAVLLSVALLLRHALELTDEARAVEDAVGRTLAAGAHTADLAADPARCRGTRAFTDDVLRHLASGAGEGAA
jgi:3-isopropylmalate dehydrogenase